MSEPMTAEQLGILRLTIRGWGYQVHREIGELLIAEIERLNAENEVLRTERDAMKAALEEVVDWYYNSEWEGYEKAEKMAHIAQQALAAK